MTELTDERKKEMISDKVQAIFKLENQIDRKKYWEEYEELEDDE